MAVKSLRPARDQTLRTRNIHPYPAAGGDRLARRRCRMHGAHRPIPHLARPVSPSGPWEILRTKS